jgi:hypothetical protein
MYRNGQVFHINSRSRNTGTDADFTYEIEFQGGTKPTHVVCLSASIPKSYYLVAAPSNTFILVEDTKQAELTLPEGNYTLISLKATLTDLLNANSPNDYTYTVSTPDYKSVDDGKLTFSVSGNDSVQPAISFANGSALFELMGFEESSVNWFDTDTLKSTNMINLQKESTLYIHSDMCSDGKYNILQEVFANNSSDFSNITYNCQVPELYAKRITARGKNVYRFYLLDENSRPINLNGGNMLITICCFNVITDDSLRIKLNNFLTFETLKQAAEIDAARQQAAQDQQAQSDQADTSTK